MGDPGGKGLDKGKAMGEEEGLSLNLLPRCHHMSFLPSSCHPLDTRLAHSTL